LLIFWKNGKKKHLAYDAIYANCQRFVYDLFEYLVENTSTDRKREVKVQLDNASKRLQSWYDKGTVKNKLKQEHSDEDSGVGTDSDSWSAGVNDHGSQITKSPPNTKKNKQVKNKDSNSDSKSENENENENDNEK